MAALRRRARSTSGGRPTRRGLVLAATLVAIAFGATAIAGDESIRGRFSLFSYWSQLDFGDGTNDSFSELVARVSASSTADTGLNWAVDFRGAAYPSEDARDERYSLYQAWVGGTMADGAFHLRLGQMWVNEIGGLGSVAGLQAEYRAGDTGIGALRVGVFGGVEIERYEVDSVPDVRKGGAYLAIDGERGRQHVLGWAHIRNDELVERSVVVLKNFIPIGKSVSLFQSGEYDLEKLAEVGQDGLSYFLANLRVSPFKRVDVYATYHRGRSLDARLLADNQLEGRPLDPDSLEGLLFETASVRLTVRPVPWLRVWAGYSDDTTNQGDESRNRTDLGFSASDLLGTGFDLTGNHWSVDPGDGSFDSWHASLGRSVGSRAYLSVDYDSTVSVFRYNGTGSGTVESRPESDRLALSANLYLGKAFTLLMSAERVDQEPQEEKRFLLGLTYRFKL